MTINGTKNFNKGRYLFIISKIRDLNFQDLDFSAQMFPFISYRNVFATDPITENMNFQKSHKLNKS